MELITNKNKKHNQSIKTWSDQCLYFPQFSSSVFSIPTIMSISLYHVNNGFYRSTTVESCPRPVWQD